MVVVGVVVSTFAVFVASSVYYVVGTPLEQRATRGAAVDRGTPGPARIGAELVRNIILTAAFAWLAHRAGVESLPDTLLLALVLWAAFPVVLLAGSVSWDRVPVPTALLHAGDWLLKLLLIGLVIGLLH